MFILLWSKSLIQSKLSFVFRRNLRRPVRWAPTGPVEQRHMMPSVFPPRHRRSRLNDTCWWRRFIFLRKRRTMGNDGIPAHRDDRMSTRYHVAADADQAIERSRHEHPETMIDYLLHARHRHPYLLTKVAPLAPETRDLCQCSKTLTSQSVFNKIVAVRNFRA